MSTKIIYSSLFLLLMVSTIEGFSQAKKGFKPIKEADLLGIWVDAEQPDFGFKAAHDFRGYYEFKEGGVLDVYYNVSDIREHEELELKNKMKWALKGNEISCWMLEVVNTELYDTVYAEPELRAQFQIEQVSNGIAGKRSLLGGDTMIIENFNWVQYRPPNTGPAIATNQEMEGIWKIRHMHHPGWGDSYWRLGVDGRFDQFDDLNKWGGPDLEEQEYRGTWTIVGKEFQVEADRVSAFYGAKPRKDVFGYVMEKDGDQFILYSWTQDGTGRFSTLLLTKLPPVELPPDNGITPNTDKAIGTWEPQPDSDEKPRTTSVLNIKADQTLVWTATSNDRQQATRTYVGTWRLEGKRVKIDVQHYLEEGEKHVDKGINALEIKVLKQSADALDIEVFLPGFIDRRGIENPTRSLGPPLRLKRLE